MRYNNYHRHDHYSNIRTPDVIVKPQNYIDRALELSHTTVFTTNHGCSSNVFEMYDLCKKNGLKCIYGMEMYYVDNRFKKDKNNYHIIVIGLTKNAYYEINRISSEANRTGFYYYPRIDMELLLSLPKDEVVITTACINNRIFKTDDGIECFLIPVKKHFGNNFMLEIQSHNHPTQIEWNKQILKLSNKYDIPIIHGNDSHYIYPQDKEDRDLFLKGKGMDYGDENNFILDYPNTEIIFKRYEKQGVLSRKQVETALKNTLIFDKAENLNFDKKFKIPSLYPNKDSNKILKKILAKKWLEEKDKIPEEKHEQYKKAIKTEMDIIEKTGMADYFILNEKIVKKAKKEYGGILTRTGRGCFTKDALIVTKEDLKTIDKVKIGDEVIADDGKFHKVINKFEYDINEELIEFEYQLQGSSKKKYKNICTKDHKILVKKNGNIIYIPANNLKVGDLLCSPKIKIKDYDNNLYIDLQKYNIYNFQYDDKYIYEVIPTNKEYKYSPRWLEKHRIMNHSLAKKIINGHIPSRVSGIKQLKRLFKNTPFKSLEDYSKYCKKHGFIRRKINRYIKKDYLFNLFIGLLYADGWTNHDTGVGLAINNSKENRKFIFNKYAFEKFAQRLGFDKKDLYYHVAKNGKNLTQIFINSKIVCNWIKTEYFVSKKHRNKIINTNLLNQSKDNLRWLYIGLLKSDGSVNRKTNKLSFDNTSLSLINLFKLLNNILGYEPMSLDIRLSHKDKRGYTNKESYKLRRPINRKRNIIESDNEYYYLPITKIIKHKKTKTKVYDISVEGNPSYMINNIIVHNSSVSFYINKLLGFTEIDRLDAEVPLYPTRFMSVSRILETHSAADIDYNTADPKPFIKASKDILGEDGIYYMVAYGTMKESAAFRNLCRAKGLKMSEYNDVAKNLELYKDNFKWKDLIKQSEKYVGVIDSISPSPCSFLLLDKPISKEIGLIRVGDEICCAIDGYTADVFGYLKNDFLTVKVWKIISDTFKLLGKPIPDIKSLKDLIDNKVWKLYEDGITATLNQVDSEWATGLVKRYKPKSIAELCAFVASIRPSFASLLDNFLDRKPYTTGVKELDEILKDSFHYMLYQESIMKYLTWLGIEEDKTYGIIKKIAKKKFTQKELEGLKTRLRNNWIDRIGNEKGFKKTWEVIENSVFYAFNASHSLSVAWDSVYGAYLKANYPLQYYKVVLDNFENDTEETAKIINELKYFNIKLKPIKFRYSRAEYSFDKIQNAIYKNLSSVKYMNRKVAEELYELGKNQYNNFAELLKDINEKTSVNSKQLDILIKLDFFSEFGKSRKLLNFVKYFNLINNAKVINKQKIEEKWLYSIIKNNSRETKSQFRDLDNNKILELIWNGLPNKDLSLLEKIQTEKEYLGYINYINPNLDKKYVLITNLNTRYTPILDVYCLNNGKTETVKISKKNFSYEHIKEGTVLYINSIKRKHGWKKVGEYKNGKPKFEPDHTKQEWWITNYSIVHNVESIIEEVAND